MVLVNLSTITGFAYASRKDPLRVDDFTGAALKQSPPSARPYEAAILTTYLMVGIFFFKL
jgi:hypothetical protein